LAAMITAILSKLNLTQLGGETGAVAGIGNLNAILNIFDMTKMIPPYFLQIIIGIYIIQIIFILSGALVVIDSGDDKLEKTNKTGLNLKKGVGLYVVTALLSIISLFLLTVIVLGNLV